MTRKVPTVEAETVTQLTKNFRLFKKQRRRLAGLGSQIEDHLNHYEKARIQEVRKPFTFLALPPRVPGKKKQRLQKETERKKNAD